MTREELVNCARWEGMAPTNEAAQDATACALMLLAVHAACDKAEHLDEYDMKTQGEYDLHREIKRILGRTT